jgi:cyanate permease
MLDTVDEMSQNVTPRRAWFVVGCAWLLSFAAFSRILCLPPIGNILKQTLSITHSKVGLIFSLPVAILAASTIPSGLFIDRVGPRRAAGIGAIAMAAGSLASGTISDLQSLLLYTSIFGIGFSITFTSLPKLIGLWFSADQVGLATGIYVTGIGAGSAISLGITLPIIFPITNTLRGTLLIWSIPGVLGAILWWFFVKEHPSFCSGQGSRTKKEKEGQSYSGWKDRNVWLTAFILFFLNIQFYTWAGWTPQLMVLKGAKPEVAAFMISFNAWISIPFMFLIPWASQKIGLVKPFIWLAGLGFLLCAWAAIYIPVPLGWPLMFFLGMLLAIFPLVLALPVHFVPVESVGEATGIVLSIGYVGALVGPWMAGYILDMSGSLNQAYIFLIGASIVLSVFGLLLPETGSRIGAGKKLGYKL